MKKFRILIADDKKQHLRLIENYISSYFLDNSLVSITKTSYATEAIQLINESPAFDFLFVDLEFENQNGLTGETIIGEAITKGGTHSRYLTVSDKTDTAKWFRCEQRMKDAGIIFQSLRKDEDIEDVIDIIRREVKAWTSSMLRSISLDQRGYFFELVKKRALNDSIQINDELVSLQVLLYCYHRDTGEINEQEVISENVNLLLDLPKIPEDRLTRTFAKYEYPLEEYYSFFYRRLYSDLENVVFSKTTKLLNSFVNCIKERTNNVESYRACNHELWKSINEQRFELSAELDDFRSERTMIRFVKRLIMRLFVLGLYCYFGLKKDEIFLFLRKSEETHPNKDNTKLFQKSLWIYDLTNSSETTFRNLSLVYKAMTSYEQAFLEKYWQSFLNKKEGNKDLENYYLENHLDKNHRYIHRFND